MKLIFTAWREYPPGNPVSLIETALDLLQLWAEAAGQGLVVVHGDARGGDRAARRWCEQEIADGRDVRHIAIPAKWAQFGVRAGRLRNEQMWTEHWATTDLCLGFPGPAGISTGTPHCMSLAAQYNIPLWCVPWGSTGLTSPPPFRGNPRGAG